MAASLTHLVIGDKVFQELSASHTQTGSAGFFLAGCVIVDMNAYQDIDRRVTHFVGRLDTDGEDSYLKSCTNFLQQLPQLLKRPWEALSADERAFVAGYLCHLAVDERWKELGAQWFKKLNITNYKDFPVHPDVMLTAYDALSRKQMQNPSAVFAALESTRIPDIFNHVSHEAICRHWNLIQDYLRSDASAEAYIHLLVQAGRYDENAQQQVPRRFQAWPAALELIESVGGESAFIETAAAHSLELLTVMNKTYSFLE